MSFDKKRAKCRSKAWVAQQKALEGRADHTRELTRQVAANGGSLARPRLLSALWIESIEYNEERAIPGGARTILIGLVSLAACAVWFALV